MKLLTLMLLLLAPGLACAAFTDNGDGTITDTVTCLQWQKATMDTNNDGTPDPLTWQQALAAAEGLTLAGKSDWRLPDKNELRSLVDYSRYNLAIDPGFAATTQSSNYWSSTTDANNSNVAWLVYFYDGNGNDGLKDSSYYARAVRGGQCGALGALGSFVFDPIVGPVTAGVGFPVRVEARTAAGALDSSVNGNISLTANYGNIYPVMLHFVNGVAEETVTVYGEGANKQLRVWQYGGREGVSNYFATSGADGCRGDIRIFFNTPGATVTLHDASGAEVAQDTPVQDGLFIVSSFAQQQCGSYTVRAEKDGKLKERSFSLSSKPVVLHMDLPWGSNTPVVLIPGMMGSTHPGSKGSAPLMKGDFPDRDLVIHWPKATGWKEMQEALESDGHPVILCPWDWRNGGKDSMQGSVDTFLIPAINEALQYSTNGKVHLVAHSMGGLLARSYIQSDLYRGDVENLALVAVPNLGSANPYFLAEGGDTKTNEAVFGKTLGVFDNLYEKTIERLWKETYEDSFQGKNSPHAKKYRDCDAEGIKEFIADKGPGMLQLLFTGKFLIKSTGTAKIESSEYVNAWLNWLNAGEHGFHPPQDRFSPEGGSKVKTRVFLGRGAENETLRWINVGSNAGALYPDGKPLGAGGLACGNDTKATGSGVVMDVGDGTVPFESAQYPLTQGWADRDAKIGERAHAYIMKDFDSEIIGFLDGTRAGTTSEVSKTAVAKTLTRGDGTTPTTPELAFSVQGAAGLLVTDSLGRRSGIVFATQEVVNEIPGAQVTSSDVASSVAIVNPAAGQYSLTYFGYEEDAFSLTLTAVNAAGTMEEEEFEGYKPATPQTMLVQYNPAATDQIIAQPLVSAPADLEENSYACGASACAALHWKASPDPGVTGYVVYRKLPYDSIHSEMARVPATTTSFNTGEAWNGEEGMPMNVYAVSAMKSGEVESFFAREKEQVEDDFPWHLFLPAILGNKNLP